MFTSGMSDSLRPFFLTTTEMISIPTGLLFLSALGTIWAGRLWLVTPMLFAMAVIFNFVIGGVTGVFLADIYTDIHLQDTYFVVAHFHYTIVGAGIFGLFAGIYFWFPKMTGRMYSERLAKLHFWWMFIGFNLTFLGMFWAGVNGMNRRVAEYIPALEDVNLFSSIAGFMLGASFLIFIVNIVHAWIRGPVAEANPWNARTLEWQTTSPPPVENFMVQPQVLDHPYEYGNPSSIHASVGVPAGASGVDEGGAE
jgi:cytochrome c oxidase subunit I